MLKTIIQTTGTKAIVTFPELGQLTLNHPIEEETQDWISNNALLSTPSIIFELDQGSIVIFIDGFEINSAASYVSPFNTSLTLKEQGLVNSVNSRLGDIVLDKTDVGLDNVQNTDTTTTINITDGINKRFVTDTQLANINNIPNFETSSSLNQRDISNRDRSNHTGTQLSNTISDLSQYIKDNETITSLNISANTLTYTDEEGNNTDIDLSLYLDDTNLARIVSGTLDSNHIATFERDDNSTFTLDLSALSDQTALSQAITNHENATDPHPQYTTLLEASAAAPIQSINSRVGNIILDKNDVNLSNVENIDTTTTANIDDSIDKRFVTDEDLINISFIPDFETSSELDTRDTTNRNRANHTGTQLANTISNFNSVASLAAPVQSVNNKTGFIVLDKNDIGLNNVINIDTTTTINISDSLDKRFITDAYLTILGNLADITISGSFNDLIDIPNIVNSINGVSGDIILNKVDIGLDNVENIDTTTTINIADSTDKRFVTDNHISNLNNLSGLNSGDETKLSIESKLGVASSTNDGYVTKDDWSSFNSKQDALGFIPEPAIPNGLTTQVLIGNKTWLELDKNAVNLSNVDNTADINKDISNATQGALDTKVDKVAGKGLSENDFTTSLKSKLENLDPNGEENIVLSVNSKIGDIVIDKSDIGLSNVVNLDTSNSANITSSTNKRFVTDQDLINLSKLSEIDNFETSAELDLRDSSNRDRSNHTGTQLSSTISDFVTAVKSNETTTSISFNANTLTYIDEKGNSTDIDLTLYLDDTNLARIVNGTLGIDNIATFTRDDGSTFTLDLSQLNDQGAIASAINVHSNAVDPHPQYITSVEAAAAAPVQSVNGLIGSIVLSKTDIGLSNVQDINTTTTLNIVDSSDKRFVTDNDLTNLALLNSIDISKFETSTQLNTRDSNNRNRGNHTGTQDISTIDGLSTIIDNKVDKITGKGLSENDFSTVLLNKLNGIQAGAQVNTVTSVNTRTGAVVISKTDVGLANVQNVNTTTTANITDSLNKRFVTDANNAKLTSLIGTNTGDETPVTIKSKLGVASTSSEGYLTSIDWNTFNNKISTLPSNIEYTTNKAQIITASTTNYPSNQAVINYVNSQLRIPLYTKLNTPFTIPTKDFYVDVLSLNVSSLPAGDYYVRFSGLFFMNNDANFKISNNLVDISAENKIKKENPLFYWGGILTLNGTTINTLKLRCYPTATNSVEIYQAMIYITNV